MVPGTGAAFRTAADATATTLGAGACGHFAALAALTARARCVIASTGALAGALLALTTRSIAIRAITTRGTAIPGAVATLTLGSTAARRALAAGALLRDGLLFLAHARVEHGERFVEAAIDLRTLVFGGHGTTTATAARAGRAGGSRRSRLPRGSRTCGSRLPCGSPTGGR